MAMPCSVCLSPHAQEINDALLTPHQSYSAIAVRFGVGRQALFRHRHTHLARELREAREMHHMLTIEALTARVQELEDDVDWARDLAKAGQDVRAVLLAVQQGRGNVELLAKLLVDANVERRLTALEAGTVVDAVDADDQSE